MAFDAFAKIEGIEGECSDDKYPGWIELLNYRAGVEQKASSTVSSVGGAGAERADFRDFSFEKAMDKSTPKLFFACAGGIHINNITIAVCRSGPDKIRFMEYELTNCIISNVNAESGGAFPFEKVSINYGKIQWCYTKQKRAGGGPAGLIVSEWDLQRNCKT